MWTKIIIIPLIGLVALALVWNGLGRKFFANARICEADNSAVADVVNYIGLENVGIRRLTPQESFPLFFEDFFSISDRDGYRGQHKRAVGTYDAISGFYLVKWLGDVRIVGYPAFKIFYGVPRIEGFCSSSARILEAGDKGIPSNGTILILAYNNLLGREGYGGPKLFSGVNLRGIGSRPLQINKCTTYDTRKDEEARKYRYGQRPSGEVSMMFAWIGAIFGIFLIFIGIFHIIYSDKRMNVLVYAVIGAASYSLAFFSILRIVE